MKPSHTRLLLPATLGLAALLLSGCTALSQIPEVDLVPAPRTLDIAPVQPVAAAPLKIGRASWWGRV